MLEEETTGTVPERVRVRVRVRRRPPRWRRRARRTVLVALTVLGLLAVLDSVWTAATAARELRAARDRLEEGGAQLREGRLDDASASFALAGVAAGNAAGALEHPAASVARLVPGLGDDVDALRTLADAAGLAAQAGTAITRAGRSAGWDGASLPGSDRGALLAPGPIEGARPELERASSLVARAHLELGRIPTDGLLGPIREAVVSARAEVGDRLLTISTAATLGEILPSMLGGAGTRRYLAVMMNMSDPRGSGGYPGSYALLEVTGGRIHLRELAQMSTVPIVAPVDAPAEVKARYARFGALTHPIATTYSPDFPTSARLLLSMWDASGRPPLDGILGVDSVAMSYLLSVTGPVSVPGLAAPITANDVSDVLDRQTFLTTSPTASDRLQDQIGTALWQTVLSDAPPPQPFASAVARAVRERHLQIYSVYTDEETALERLGAAGAVHLPANPLMVAWDGGVANRAGYFAEKAVAYHAVLGADGSAEVTIDVTLHNLAPVDGTPSILLGTGDPGDVPIGTYVAYVSAYLPVSADDVRIRGGTLGLREEELGHPVAFAQIGAPAGGSATIHVTYRASSLATSTDGGFSFRLDVLPLPELRPQAFSVRVTLPRNAVIRSTCPGTVSEGPDIRWSGAPVSPTAVCLRYDVSPSGV